MINLDTSLKSIPKITPKYAKNLQKLGLLTVRDFLTRFPFRYDDFSNTATLSEEHIGKTITVEGEVTKARNNRIFRRRMTVTEVVMEDSDRTPLKVAWFNQPFILDSLRPGSLIRVSGKLDMRGKFFSMSSPSWERAGRDATHTGRLVPIYATTAGLTSKWIRWQLKPLLPLTRSMPDILPEDMRRKYHLPDLYDSICQIHFPDSKEKLIRAQKRFAFEEMFLVQLKSLEVKSKWDMKSSSKISFDKKLVKNFVDSLPFTLTDAQRKASFEILKDLEKPKPMNRLLNGDVGSGKTVVAAIASLQAVSSGRQVAIMAPTEVLARQHFFSFQEIFKSYGINIALLTNSYRETNNFQFSIFNFQSIFNDKILKNKNASRQYLINNIAESKINIVIGTHALIQKDVRFKNLSLIIIDEQHRFGVAQRAALQEESMNIDDGNEKTIPHLLTMTATPIPRTLAIAFFGSLDLSVLDEMPKNRKPIITKIVTPDGRQEVYDFIRREIDSGRQAFVIFPLVEESKALSEVKAATAEHERLSEEIFPDYKLGLLHGKMKAGDKEKVMADFKEKKCQILVATSVVEVGIDVPNSTVMIIENAERFGMSQLHQFRGRVGRGEHQSYCFLFTDAETSRRGVSIERLEALEKTNDGFEISKIDLQLRGPGQFFGRVQSGLPDITMENLANVKLIKFAREEAKKIFSSDPELKTHPLLADALKKFSNKIHLE